MPSEPSEPNNPYLQLADVLHEIFWLAAQARARARAGKTVSVAELNGVTDPWDEAARQARRGSLARGIPFEVFDAALSSAQELLHELVQVSAGNESVYFHSLDLKYVNAERRLRELAATFGGTGADSDQAIPEPAEGTGQRQSKKPGEQAPLSSAVRKAYLSFEAARLKAEKKDMKDWEAYKVLKEEGIPEGIPELADYRLPAKDTWCRYLRTARKALEEQKYTRRRGRPHGKSIVRQHQIEPPDNDDK
jgi:hypothetical protein